ncbi:hypothetical protein LIER_34861 [Lithospermum erythrorhizon]|uniref:Uncharacterized protein n=1 Tax=Lithospermum erythrorhizon TaxID=34254 RepID=A0AAV3S0W4_LITER
MSRNTPELTVSRVLIPMIVQIACMYKSCEKNSEKMFHHLGRSKSGDVDRISQCSSIYHHERACSSQSGDGGSSGPFHKQTSLVYTLRSGGDR